MRKVTYYCDRCGKLIDSKMARLTTVFIDTAFDIEEEQEDGAELCMACYWEVDQVTANAVMNKDMPAPEEKPVEEPVQKPEEKPKKVPHNKVEIDMPEVFALKNAGWSLDKIGQEFRVSGQTIANHIAAYNKEVQ